MQFESFSIKRSRKETLVKRTVRRGDDAVKANRVATLGQVLSGTRTKAVIYYASSSLVCQAVRCLGILLTTRMIAPEQFGLFAEAALLMSVAGLFREIGQSGALVAYQGKDRRYIYFNFQLNAGLGLGAGALVFASLLIPRLIPDDLRGYIWLPAAILLLDSLTFTSSLMLQKHLRFKVLGIVEIFTLVVWLSTVCLTVGRFPGLLVLLSSAFAESLCRCFLLFIVTGRRFVGFASGKDLWQYYLYTFARPVIPLVMLQNVLTRSDFLLLTLLSTTRDLGTYERLGQFSRIPISLTVNLCDKVLMHSYSHFQNDRSALQRLVKKSMLLITLGVVVITAVVTVMLFILLKFLVGPDWAAMVKNLWWFGVPVLVLTPILSNITLFLSGLGMQGQLLRNTALNLLTDLMFGIPLVVAFGARGMLLAKSISAMVSLGYQARVLYQRVTMSAPLQMAQQRS
jgi:polysaccharide transporter, PST family